MKQILTGGYYDALDVNATEYNCIPGGIQWYATESTRTRIVPISGTMKNLYVYLSAAPGAGGSGKSYTFTIMKDGVATGLEVTISETATSGSIETDVSFSAGEMISIRAVPSATDPDTPIYARYTALFETSDNSSIIMGNTGGSNLSTTITYYDLINSVQLASETTESEIAIPIPYSGTIKNLYVEISAAPGAAKKYDFTIMKSGSLSTVTASISGAVSTTSYDTTHSISVSAGDTISIRFRPNGTPTAATAMWGIVFDSDKVSTSVLLGGTQNNLQTGSALRYQPMESGYYNEAEQATESQKILYLQDCRLSDLRLRLQIAPGISKSYTFTVRKNAADTSLFDTIQDSDTTGYDTEHNVSFALGDYTSLQEMANGTPSTGDSYWSCLCRYEDFPDGPYFTVSTDEDYRYIPMINSLSFGDSKDIEFFGFNNFRYPPSPIFSNIDVGKETENISISGEIFYEDKDKLDWMLDASYRGKDITIDGFDNTELDATWTIEGFSYSGSYSTPSMYTWNMKLEKTY